LASGKRYMEGRRSVMWVACKGSESGTDREARWAVECQRAVLYVFIVCVRSMPLLIVGNISRLLIPASGDRPLSSFFAVFGITPYRLPCVWQVSMES
jgi:hypothetical protein